MGIDTLQRVDLSCDNPNCASEKRGHAVALGGESVAKQIRKIGWMTIPMTFGNCKVDMVFCSRCTMKQLKLIVSSEDWSLEADSDGCAGGTFIDSVINTLENAALSDAVTRAGVS